MSQKKKNSPLNAIVGKTIRQVDRGRDYLGIAFDGGYGLSIYNSYEISKGDFDKIVGSFAESINETEEFLRINLANGIEILVDLRAEAYQGPEAIQLNGPDNLIVIWN